jgi:hypothetical protein
MSKKKFLKSIRGKGIDPKDVPKGDYIPGSYTPPSHPAQAPYPYTSPASESLISKATNAGLTGTGLAATAAGFAGDAVKGGASKVAGAAGLDTEAAAAASKAGFITPEIEAALGGMAKGGGGGLKALLGSSKLLKGAGWVGLALLAMQAGDALYGSSFGKRKEQREEMENNASLMKALVSGQQESAMNSDDERFMTKMAQSQAARETVAGGIGASNQASLDQLVGGQQSALQQIALRDRPSIMDLIGSH